LIEYKYLIKTIELTEKDLYNLLNKFMIKNMDIFMILKTRLLITFLLALSFLTACENNVQDPPKKELLVYCGITMIE